MKHLLLLGFALLSSSAFAQAWKVGANSLHTGPSDTKIGIGANGTDIVNEKVLLYADTITLKGGKVGLRCLMGGEGSYFQGYIDSRVGTVGNWDTQGQGYAMSGKLTLMKTSASTDINSFSGGGVLSLVLDNYSNSGPYINYAGGSVSWLKGTIGSIAPNTAIGAVIAIDDINTASTWAGYFKGRGYFSGNVGIGTTATNAALTVKGKIECEEVEVKNIGADYVFANDYQLMPLSEVESFINTNGHLPGVAPASETEKGVNLAQFSETLLQKVEELTLYMIELKKENEQLRKEVEELSKKSSK